MAYRTVMMKPQDHVAVALENIPVKATVEVRCKEETFVVTLLQDIEFGHKFAVRPIPQGDPILKYGEVIGKASAEIRVGEHVHIHNLEGVRGRGDKKHD